MKAFEFDIVKIKIFPIYGDIFTIELPKRIYDEDRVDEFINDFIKNVDYWEYC